MMQDFELTDFFLGYGSFVISIDDRQNDDLVLKSLLDDFESNFIPTVRLSNLPNEPETFREVFSRASLLLLDYSFQPSRPGTSFLQEENEGAISRVVQEFCSVSFSPVFLFSNNPVGAQKRIIDRLDPSFSKRIFSLAKEQKTNSCKDIKAAIEEKYKETMKEFYAYQAWSKSVNCAKREVFKDLFFNNPNWISWIYDESKDGDQNITKKENDLNFSSFLNQNLLSRYKTPSFSLDKPNEVEEPNEELVIKLFQSLRTERVSFEEKPFWRSGDLFKIDVEEAANLIPNFKKEGIPNLTHLYLLNISAPCSMARGNGSGLFAVGFPQDILPKSNNQSEFRRQIKPISKHLFIGFLDEKAVEFDFRFVSALNSENVETRYVGRLLEPYLQEIRSRFLLYINRSGVLCDGLGFYATRKTKK